MDILDRSSILAFIAVKIHKELTAIGLSQTIQIAHCQQLTAFLDTL